MEFLHYSDTQLEDVIDKGLAQCSDDSWLMDLEEFVPVASCGDQSEFETDFSDYSPKLESDDGEATFMFAPHEDDQVASYVVIDDTHVPACDDTQFVNIKSEENSDCESVSQLSVASSSSSLDSQKTLKLDTKEKPKRKQTKRTKRVYNDKIKHQNKVAAIKYRQRKKEEFEVQESLLDEETNRNLALKQEIKELKMQIKIIKRLMEKQVVKQ